MIIRRLLQPATFVAVFVTATNAAAAHRHQHHRDHGARHVHAQKGLASYYGGRQAGRTTASGKPMQSAKLTAASKTLPLGTKARVTNLQTGRSVKVTVTDRGPFAKSRILDVSPTAARKLEMKHDGVAPVKVQPVEIPSSK